MIRRTRRAASPGDWRPHGTAAARRPDLPERFGDPIKIHTRFSRRAKSGVWKRIFQHLAADADNEYAMIDSTIAPAHQHSAGAQKNRRGPGIGPSRGGLSTKIHALVDALGNPVDFYLTGGEVHDLVGADHLLPTMADTVIGDRAFDADERVIKPLLAAGKTVVIPPRANRQVSRDYDRDLFKARHLIENSFARLKQFRAIATRSTTKPAPTSWRLYSSLPPSFGPIQDTP